MQNTPIKLALAAILAAPMTAGAGAMLFGKAHLSVDYVDVEKNAVNAVQQFNSIHADALAEIGGALDPVVLPVVRPPNVGGFNGWDTVSRSSRFGVKGNEALGNGLKAIYQISVLVPMANANNNIVDGDPGRATMHNSFVGLSSRIGSILVGRHDTPMKISTLKLDQFRDLIADFNRTVGFYDVRADNIFMYTSPTVSGFKFIGGVIAPGGANMGRGSNLENDSLAGVWSVAGTYSQGPFYGSLAYERFDQENWYTCNEEACRKPPQIADWSHWRIGLALLDWKQLTLSGIYEKWWSAEGERGEDADLWQIQAGYRFGNNKLFGMYGKQDRQGSPSTFFNGLDTTGWTDQMLADGTRLSKDVFSGGRSTWAVALNHYFSKRTRIYAVYTAVDEEVPDGDWSGFSLGMIHVF